MGKPRLLLLPFVPFYALVTWIRGILFNQGVLSSKVPSRASICVGNICAGGSGKTPHVEYLIRLLGESNKICTLSRGYGRKTKGYRLAQADETESTIGDEPMQYYEKFKNVRVCVDEDRVNAIQNINKTLPETDVILLDDAYQHRYVDAGLKILLTDYYNPYFEDYLLPLGNLREFRSAAQRAHVIVVTKSPKILSPITRKSFLEKLNAKVSQHVFFSYLKHGAILSFSGEVLELKKDVFNYFLVFTGIYNPYPLVEYLRTFSSEVELIKFPDHHKFSEKDFSRVRKKFEDYYCNHKYLITTEKDYMRLKSTPAFEVLKDLPLYYVPLEVEFQPEDKVTFDKHILNYVSKNKTNR